MPGSLRRALIAGGIAVALIALSRPAEAQRLRFGLRAGAYTNGFDPFIGADVLIPMSGHWNFDPNLDFVPGDHEDDLVVSADFHYDYPAGNGNTFWLGAGPSIIVRDFTSAEDNETKLGVGVLAGYSFRPFSGLLPYVQGKVLISNRSRVVVGAGLRF